MVEVWDLYNDKKQLTHQHYQRGCNNNIPKGMFHLVVEIWVIHNGKILITQRHPEKCYGLKWECSGGSVLQGEDSIQGALRELYEEIGIKAKMNELLYIGDTYHSNYIVDTYLYNQYIQIEDLVLQPHEVVDAKYVSFTEMQDMYNKNELVQSVWERFCYFKDQLL